MLNLIFQRLISKKIIRMSSNSLSKYYLNMTVSHKQANSNYLVWVDCEMTGLNIEIDRLMEIAVIITGSLFNYLK